MSLIVTLRVNDGPAIGHVTVQRLEGDTAADSMGLYRWKVYAETDDVQMVETSEGDSYPLPLRFMEETASGTLRHRYGDGALALLAATMKEWENSR